MHTDHPTTLPHPLLLLIRGLPGSGKSYLAAELQRSFGEDRVVMLDPDGIDFNSEAYQKHAAALVAEGVDEKIHPFRFLRDKAFGGIETNKVIIWNQPFTQLEMFGRMIEKLETHATEHNISLPIMIVEVNTDPAVAQARVTDRKKAGGHGPSDSTFERFVRDYTGFVHQNYDVVSVDGANDVAISTKTVMDHAATLLRA